MKRMLSLLFLCGAAALTAAAGGAENEACDAVAGPSVESVQPEEAPCAAAEEEEDPFDAFDEFDEFADEYGNEVDEANSLADPFIWWNKGWFYFNDTLHFYFLKPVAKSYGILVPRVGRVGLRNMLTNLNFPKRFVNTLLQGRLKCANTELGRFLLNSTVGVVGLWDPSTKWLHLELHKEDFDQTLGVWGVGQGIFLTWPFFGPSSLRGTFGLAADTALNVVPGGAALERINNLSLDKDAYEALLKMALDPYATVRNAYVQNRREVIGK